MHLLARGICGTSDAKRVENNWTDDDDVNDVMIITSTADIHQTVGLRRRL